MQLLTHRHLDHRDRCAPMECAASLDVMKLRRVVSDARYQRGNQLLEGIVAMLTKML